MRIAAIYDIHGNLPALEAVLAAIAKCDVDLIVVGGDVVPGPMPRQVLDLLYGLETPKQFIRGNCEMAVLDHLAHRSSRSLPPDAIEAIAWTAEQLRPEDLFAFESWPRTLGLSRGASGEVLFCHATPRDEDECFTRLTPERLLAPIFSGLETSLVVCGHTHMQFDRTISGIRVVNAGSVGMPFGEPGAEWLLLDAGVELKRTVYNFEDAAARIKGTGYPQAEGFAEGNVLRPPSEEVMLAVFAKAEGHLARKKGE